MGADGMANPVDTDQIRNLMWVYIVCPDLSVQKPRIITVYQCLFCTKPLVFIWQQFFDVWVLSQRFAWFKKKMIKNCLSNVWEELRSTLNKKYIIYEIKILIIYGFSSFCSPVTSRNKLSRLMSKPTKWLCAQQRLRSAWASTSLIRVFAVRSMGS